MDEQSISVRSMASTIGVNPRTIQRIRRGKQDRTGLPILIKIAHVLGVPADKLTKTYCMRDCKKLFGADDISW